MLPAITTWIAFIVLYLRAGYSTDNAIAVAAAATLLVRLGTAVLMTTVVQP